MKSSDMEIVFRAFENSSLLTATKIVKAQSRIHRVLWVVFALVMLIILSACICISVLRYLDFAIMVQRTIHFNTSTDFPAVTFCNPQPFSLTAENPWRSGRTMSPSEFNRHLRMYLFKNIANRTIKSSRRLEQQVMHPIFQILKRDSSYYYTYIGTNKSIEIGHKVDEMFVFCEVKLIQHSVKALKQTQGTTPDTCLFKVNLVSSPEFFNCYTIQPPKEYSSVVRKVTLILDLGTAPDKRWVQVASSDWSDNRLMFIIHEPDTNPFGYTSYDRERMYAKAHESIDILYEPILHSKLNSPKQKCVSKEEIEHMKVSLSGHTYKYTQSTCLFHHGCDYYTKECNCTCSRRPESKEYPYCRRFNFNDSNPKSVLCKLKLNLYKLCHARCTFWEYRKVVNRRHWSPDKLKLLFLKAQNNVLEFHKKKPFSQKIFDELKEMITAKNLSKVMKLPPHMEKRKDKYLRFVIERQSLDIQHEEEKLLMTMTNLFSEVGGLCSLFMGLSLTFIFELFEICGLFLFRRTQLSHSFSTKQNYRDRQLKTLNQSANNFNPPEPTIQDDILLRPHANNTIGWLSD